jgi:formylglycine-generating enzyme required for sulfatase activity
MGCTGEQGYDCAADEKQIHHVTLGNYFIGETEVTQSQWRKVMGSDPPGLKFKGCNDCPVEGINWNEAQMFISKLNSINEGTRYRLPTEAEWEYAARGATALKDISTPGVITSMKQVGGAVTP